MPKVFIRYFSGTGNTKRGVDLITGELEINGYQVTQFLMGRTRPEVRENADLQISAFPGAGLCPSAHGEKVNPFKPVVHKD